MSVPWEKSLTIALTASILSVIAYNIFERTKLDLSDNNVTDTTYPDDIRDELTSRVQTFFGNSGFKAIENSFVVVVGLGGVGSHCANMLVRSGVHKVRLIDFDQVTLSSLNRHALANMHDVGTSKAEALRKRLLEVVPWCDIEAVVQMFKGGDADKLLQGNPDFVLDCIDDVHTKAELIAYCLEHKLRVITSMGAGGKSDPTRMRIAPLSDCINDPLASKIKWKLKKHHGVSADDVLCVFSAEKPKVDLLPLDEEQRQSPQDYGAVDYLRLRIMPVLGTSPSIFGQSMASFVLCKIAGKPYEPEVCERMSRNLKHKVLQFLKKNETQRFGDDRSLDIDDSDIEFVVQEVWKTRCASTGRRFGGHVCLTLTRWDASRPPVPDNLVLLMHGEAQRLAEKGQSAFRPEVVQRITDRLAWASRIIAAEETATDPTEKSTVVSRIACPTDSPAYLTPRTGAVVTGAFAAGVGVGLLCCFW